MLLPLCNYQLFIPSKASPNSSFFFPSSFLLPHLNQNPNVPSKSLSLRTSTVACAANADTQTLPQSAIQRIAEKLRSLGYVEDEEDDDDDGGTENSVVVSNTKGTSPGEIFVPLPNQLPKYRVGHTIDSSWSTPENPVPVPGSGTAIQRYHVLRREFVKEKERERVRMKVEEVQRVPTLAELTLRKEELRRLRAIGIALRKKLKVGKAGITEGIVNGIHERWRREELVKINCEDLSRMNMKRTHDLLERKTGGLVIWRSGSNIILYRGANYKYPYFTDNDPNNPTSASTSLGSDTESTGNVTEENCSSGTDGVNSDRPNGSSIGQPPLIRGVGSPNRVRFQLPGEAQLAEEGDRMIDGLGPRFTDWWGYDPLPVDADLLPAVVPGYRKPFRLLPYGVKPKLTNDEMTTLRRLARYLPCHFALGRNKKLQGLAASIIKLWEKCEIAKVAIKRGVQNTNSELMAEEIMLLTGGIMLSRDREFIVFYRGKDFLPAAVSSAIEERRKFGVRIEKQKTEKSSTVSTRQDHKLGTREDSSKDEYYAITNSKRDLVSEKRKLRSPEAVIGKTSTKLQIVLEKKAKAEELLAELDKVEIPQQPVIDKEGITEEERYMLRKVGLQMNPFLLLGRRGVFAGTVENMHLHWKYRELVKIICSAKSIEEIHGVARTLEAESGGILVAVERVSKGFAIIVYRGKNYKRPASLRPHTLLTKREALKRSIEEQRRESLRLHVLELSRNIDELKLKLAKDEMKSMHSAKEFKPQLVKEHEVSRMQSGKDMVSGTELERISFSSSETPLCNEENADAIERYEAGSISLDSNDGADSGHCPKTSNVNIQSDKDNEESEFNINEQLPSSNLVLEESNASRNVDGECGDAESSIGHDNILDQSTVPSVIAPKREIESSDHRAVKNGSADIPFRALQLSNRDRLLLRKQALKMRKRPVLAVGKSNIITGVAKTIKEHFQKYPLAIVNVKGRAKGTSVHEVVSKLEQATGAVLVSQEPSKVILYRGWGAGEESGRTLRTNTKDTRSTSSVADRGNRPVVSPELISAIRLECGFPSKQNEKEVS